MKTMKKYLFMAVAAIAALSSCSSDNDFEQSQTGKQALVFTATMENSEATRATFDNTDKCAAWEAGDQISINGKTYSAQTAGTTTTFEADNEGATGTTYNAYFPADLYDGTTATLPAIQTYEAGEFNMPMYASSTTTTLAFKNLCAVLAVKITSDDIATLKSIKVASDKVMNGSFTVTDNKAVMGTDGSNAVVLSSSTALTLTSEGTTFYIAIPAQEYKYLNIFLSADGETYTQAMATKNAAGLGEIARSKIFNIDYAKNATKLRAGNLFFADCNVGATSAEEYGGYFAWGGSQDKFDDHNTGTSALTGDTDTAYKLWGSNWRMMAINELTMINNLGSWDGNGLLCKSPDYEGNTVFLPAAGCYDSGQVNSQGSIGYYWCSTPGDATTANFQITSSTYQRIRKDGKREKGYSVRAVLEEAASPEPPAPATKGTAKRTGDIDVNWVQLWKGGPKFAEYNVGATSATEIGGYYTWGGTYKNGTGITWDGTYNTTNDGTENLAIADDTAHKLWGNNWRMPTKEEFEALIANCDAEWTDNYNNLGLAGTIYTGKDNYSENSIFIPVAGLCEEGAVRDININCVAYYWSSTPYTNAGALFLCFNNTGAGMEFTTRDYGFPVRPVLSE